MRSKSSMRPLDAGRVRDGEEVQHRVGRAAGRHDHGDRVLDRLARDDVARLQVVLRPPRPAPRAGFAALRRPSRRAGWPSSTSTAGSCRAPRTPSSSCWRCTCRRTSRCRGWRGARSRRSPPRSCLPGGELADRLEDADDVQVLALVAARAGWCRRRRRSPARWRAACPSCRRACSCRSRRSTSTPSIHWPPTQVSMQSAMTSRETRLYFMPSVPIAMPSRDGRRAEDLRVAAGGLDAVDGRVGELLQARVARRDRRVAVGDADHRLLEVAPPRSRARSTSSGSARAPRLR